MEIAAGIIVVLLGAIVMLAIALRHERARVRDRDELIDDLRSSTEATPINDAWKKDVL